MRAAAILGILTSLGLLWFLPMMAPDMSPGHMARWLSIACFLLGVASAGHILTFSVIRNITASHITATAIGFINMAVVAGGILMQPTSSILLDLVHQHTTPYSTTDFQYALILIPLCYGVAYLATIRPSAAQHQHLRHEDQPATG